MKDPLYYQTIDKTSTAEYKDRGSRFIAFVFPASTPEQFKEQLQLLKKEHPKAVHHCFAYRMSVSGDIFRSSDDGEPSGTAGKPILGQIDSKQLTDTAVVVVRYFGGTLLGVPGLIQAYKSAAAMALQLVPVVQKPIEVSYELQFDYTLMNEVMMVVKSSGASVLAQDLQLFCLMKIGIPKVRLEETLFRFGELHTLNIKPVKE
jgi:uncharacterized YigZ family protein